MHYVRTISQPSNLMVTCTERPPFYIDHLENPSIRNVCTDIPVNCSHLPIKTRTICPEGDRYKQVLLQLVTCTMHVHMDINA